MRREKKLWMDLWHSRKWLVTCNLRALQPTNIVFRNPIYPHFFTQKPGGFHKDSHIRANAHTSRKSYREIHPGDFGWWHCRLYGHRGWCHFPTLYYGAGAASASRKTSRPMGCGHPIFAILCWGVS